MKLKVLPPVQEKLFLYFLENQDERMYVNELIRITGEYPNSIHFALKTLEKLKILESKYINKKKFFWLNKANPSVETLKEIYSKKQLTTNSIKNNDWIKLLNRDASLAFQAEVPLVNKKVLPKVINYQINNFWFNGITHGVYYREFELQGLAKAIQTKIENDPGFAKKNVDDCYKLGSSLIKASNVADKKDLKTLKSKELLKLLNRYQGAYLKFLPYLVYPHSIERYFLAEIKKQLENTMSGKCSTDKIDEYFELLTTPTIHEIEQQIEMLKCANRLINEGWSKITQEELKQIHAKYAWQTLWTIEAESLNIRYFKDAIEALSESKDKESLLKEAQDLVKQQEKRKKTLVNTLKKIKAGKKLTDLVKILQSYMYLRTYRKNIISQAHYLHLPLVEEIGRRMKVGSNISLVTYEEMQDFLKTQKVPSKITLGKRKTGWGVIAFDGNIQVVSGLNSVLEIMEQFQIGNNPIPIKTQQKITGSPACKGKAVGKVRVIKHINELSNLQKGEILVARMTTPDFVPALNKVEAIVTDEGGVTCHAAIVSREFGIPCIVGTRNATQILSDGDKVEVDANNGTVTIIGGKTTERQDNIIIGKQLYKGKTKGTVLNIASEEDLEKVTPESIIVTSTVTPRFLSALYKVKGFITDDFSPTSHGYLYAQSLKIPSIGGTNNASELLHTGEKIELDADKNLVRLIE